MERVAAELLSIQAKTNLCYRMNAAPSDCVGLRLGSGLRIGEVKDSAFVEANLEVAS